MNLLRRYIMMVDAVKRRFARSRLRAKVKLSATLERIITRIRSAICSAVSLYGSIRTASAVNIEANAKTKAILNAILREIGLHGTGSVEYTVELTAVIDSSGNVVDGYVNAFHKLSGRLTDASTAKISGLTKFDVSTGAFAARCDVYAADSANIVLHVITRGTAVGDLTKHPAESDVRTKALISALLSECENRIAGLGTFVYLMSAEGNGATATPTKADAVIRAAAAITAFLTRTDNAIKSLSETTCRALGELDDSGNRITGTHTSESVNVSGELKLADPWIYPVDVGDDDEGLLITQVYSVTESGGGLIIE